jgi:multidrug efflux pump
VFLPELSIKRPVLATVMSLVIILIGVISFLRLTVREYPKIDTPVVSVRTVYKGASPQVIESQVTQPLEDSISGIEGVKSIKSVSREEVSQITVEFVLERNTDAAANDVRDRVSRVRGQLPDEVDEPIIAKIEADAQAILWLRLFSDRHAALEISDYADRFVVDRLKTLSGVASVIIGGERRYAMRLWLDRERLAAYGLTPQDVEDALRRQNVEVPSGRIESTQREFTVLSESDLRTPEQFSRLIVREVNGYPIRLRDVGRAELGPQDERNRLRVNGRPAVGMGVVKQSTANTLAVARAVKSELPKLRAVLPPGMDLDIAFDTSVFIERSIEAVYEVMLEALLLVVLVIFFFLRSLRATLIPFVTIPVSLIGAFFLIWIMGFTINVLTLLGIVLAIGLVVDDAIVMLENIHRHVEEGMEPVQAAITGSREIAFAIVAMTITLVAVFAPLAFSTGNTGRLFMEFALTVAAAVLVSGFVALTLTPMMCSKLLRRQRAHNRAYNALERFFAAMSGAYRRGLASCLRHRLVVVGVFAVVAAVGGAIFATLKSELSPLEDRGFFLGVMVAPEGATMDYTDGYARIWEEIYKDVPEILTYFVSVAPGLDRPNPVNTAISFMRLKDWSERDRSTQQITAALQPRMAATMPGVIASLINPPSLGQSFRNPPVQFVVQGNSYEQLDRVVNELVTRARAYPGFSFVDSDLKLNKPQLKVDINREKAAALGVQVETIGRTLETLLGGRQVTRFKREGKQYDVLVQLEDKDRRQPDDLTSIYVRGGNGRLVQLANLVTVTETVAPKELNHFNRLRAAIISANLTPGQTLSEALDFMDRTAKAVLTAEYQTALDGQSREFRESGQQLYFVFFLALAFIYLVLSAQFESFRGPLVIMLTVPLAITGALAAMKLAGVTLNVYSQIGLVMLIGLITKNGILIVEFTNQLRDRGMAKVDALVEASCLRLRPILMTTAATVLGSLPLAVSAGAGSESRSAIGWVIVGGMALGTLFTLFIIPVAYTYIVGDRHLPAEDAAGGAVAPPSHAPAGKA